MDRDGKRGPKGRPRPLGRGAMWVALAAWGVMLVLLGALLAWELLGGDRDIEDVWALVAALAVAAGGTLYTALALPAYITRHLAPGLEALETLAGQVAGGALGTQAGPPPRSCAELEQLRGTLNGMSRQLTARFEQMYRAELALRDARVKALERQTDPQFLSDTLEIVAWEAQADESPRVAQMLDAVTTLLRAAWEADKKPVVTLTEELISANAYLFILRQRMGRRLQVRQEIDSDLMDWELPRLTLQPLVQNAVEHGADGQQRSTVTIRVNRAEDGWMRLEVENDGVMDEERLLRVRALLDGTAAAQGGSLAGLDWRLRSLYGERGALEVRQTAGGGTVFSACVAGGPGATGAGGA